jgi:hypothetical protein
MMPKTYKRLTRLATAKNTTQKLGNKKTVDEPNDLDTTPRKKSRATAMRFSIIAMHGFTANPFAKGLKNKINVVFYESGVPPKDGQPQVTLCWCPC